MKCQASRIPKPTVTTYGLKIFLEVPLRGRDETPRVLPPQASLFRVHKGVDSTLDPSHFPSSETNEMQNGGSKHHYEFGGSIGTRSTKDIRDLSRRSNNVTLNAHPTKYGYNCMVLLVIIDEYSLKMIGP